jgi:hypothetical protein
MFCVSRVGWAEIGRVVLLFSFIGIGGATVARAQMPDLMKLPGNLNLGYTSYLDGFGLQKPGCMYLQYVRNNYWNEIHDKSGHDIPLFDNPKIDETVGASQLLCDTPFKIFGGWLGFEGFVPVANFNTSFGPSGIVLQDNGFGLADIAFAPFVQMPAIIHNGHPIFAQRFSFYFSAPIGKFDTDKDINQSNGYWSFQPYWAATLIPGAQWELSWRLYYIYNFETSDVATSLIPNVGSLFQNGRAGQATLINFTASYAITKQLRLGLNGYYLRQLTDDELNGQSYSGGKEEALYIGPGLHYDFDANNLLNFNVYLPVEDKNRFSGGEQFNLMLVHIF